MWNSKAAHSYKLSEDGMQHTSSCFLLRISLMRWAPILHWVLLQHTEHKVSAVAGANLDRMTCLIHGPLTICWH